MEEEKEEVGEEEERHLEAGEEKGENSNHEGISGEEKKSKSKTKVDFKELNSICKKYIFLKFRKLFTS